MFWTQRLIRCWRTNKHPFGCFSFANKISGTKKQNSTILKIALEKKSMKNQKKGRESVREEK